MDVLHVEDGALEAALVRQALCRGAVVRPAITLVRTLGEALAAVTAHPFDVVLLDVQLPDTYGLEGVSRLRAAAPRIPIVVLSGSTDETLEMAALHEGAQDFVVKGPFDAEQLRRVIRHAILRERVLDEVERLRDQSSGLRRELHAVRQLRQSECRLRRDAGRAVRAAATSILTAASGWTATAGADEIASDLADHAESLFNLAHLLLAPADDPPGSPADDAATTAPRTPPRSR